MFDTIYVNVYCDNPDVDIFHIVESLRNRFMGGEVCTSIDYELLSGESECGYDYSKIMARQIVVKNICNWFDGDITQSEHLEYLSQLSSNFDEDDDVVVSLLYPDYDENKGDFERDISFKCGKRITSVIYTD